MIILPAIDIKDGNCVRLVRGDYGTAHKVAEDYMQTAQSSCTTCCLREERNAVSALRRMTTVCILPIFIRSRDWKHRLSY